MYIVTIEDEKEKSKENFWNVEDVWIHNDNILICQNVITSMRKINKNKKITIEVQ